MEIKLSDERIKPHATSNNSLAPSLNYIGTITRVKFHGSCLKLHIIDKNHIYLWKNSKYIHCLWNKFVGSWI